MEPDIVIDFPPRRRRPPRWPRPERPPTAGVAGSIAAVLLLFGVLLPLAAGGGPRGDVQFKLSGSTSASQPATAPLGPGKIVVVWRGPSTGPGSGIFARIGNGDGTGFGPEINVAASGTEPAVAADEAGNFLVAWTDADDVYTRPFDAAGTPLRDALRLNLETSGRQSEPAVAAVPGGSGRFAVAFSGNGVEDIESAVSADQSLLRRDESGIWLRYTGPSGNEAVQTLANAASTAGDQRRPSLVAPRSDLAIVVWDGQGPGDPAGIFGATVTPAQFAPVEPPTPLNNQIGPAEVTPLSSVAGVQTDPRITLSGTTPYVVWSGEGADDLEGIWYAPFDGSARREVRVNAFVDGPQQHPVITAPSGSPYLTVAWDGPGPDDGSGVYARRFNPAVNGGRPLTAEFLVNTPAAGTQTRPALAPTANGDYTVVFDSLDGASSTAVFARPYRINDPPAVEPETYEVDEDTTLIADGVGARPAGVLANDVDADGDTMTAGLTRPPARGTLTLAEDGTFTYVPAAGYTGLDTFEYRVRDNQGTPSAGPATVTISVRAIDDGGPVAAADHFTGAVEDTRFTVDDPDRGLLANDTDPDPADVLTASLRPNSAARSGVVVVRTDGTFSYTPDPNFCGEDVFDYVVTDGTTTSNPARATVEVGCVKDPPGARDDRYATIEDTDLVVPARGVLQNDFLEEGTVPDVTLEVAPKHGKLIGPADDGSFTYRPNADFNGVDVFTYSVRDASSPAPPPAPSGSASGSGSGSSSGGATPPDDGGSGGGGAGGTLDPVTDLVPVPLPGAGGEQTDPDPSPPPATNAPADAPPAAAGSAAQVIIQVGQTEDSPLVSHDAFFTPEDTPLTVPPDKGLLANDADPDLGTLTARLATPPSRGKITNFDSDGSFTYQPFADFNGSDVFTYQVTNETGKSSTGKVEILVGPQGDRIIATDDRYQVQEDTALTVAAPGLLGNDVDPDGGKLALALVEPPGRGTLELNGDGSFVYAPAPDTDGVDRFTYRITDPDGNEATAGAVILVRPVDEVRDSSGATVAAPTPTAPPPPPPAVEIKPAAPPPPPPPPPVPALTGSGGPAASGAAAAAPPPPPVVLATPANRRGPGLPVAPLVAGAGGAGLLGALAGLLSRRRTRLQPLETLPL